MKYLHTMVRIENIEESLYFYCTVLGLKEIKRKENKEGKYTLIFLGDKNSEDETGLLELTYNWDQEKYSGGRNFGHLAYSVKDIYKTCEKIKKSGITINRPPRDGRMAFIKSPDGISIELLQEGGALPLEEPWLSMKNVGSW